MVSNKHRARSDHEKLERRQSLINQAWALFQAHPYEAINIIDVAHGLNLAKGTVYVYFKTKEALFLAVLIDQFELWFNRVDTELATAPNTLDAVVNVLADALDAQPALNRLFAITHVILEQNVDYDSALAYKQFLRERVLHTGGLLEAKLSFLQPGTGPEVLLQAYALVIGIQHMADPAPLIQQILMSHPELALFEIQLSVLFRHSLTAMLQGLASQSTASECD